MSGSSSTSGRETATGAAWRTACTRRTVPRNRRRPRGACARPGTRVKLGLPVGTAVDPGGTMKRMLARGRDIVGTGGHDARDGGGPRARRTAPASARRGSSRSATPRSPVRPDAGPATRTAAPTTSTRSARPRTTTTRRNTAETIHGCHRSKSAEIYIGGGVNGMNLACSGARTYTQTPGSGDFKPGLDFFSDSSGHQGQALMLQQFAASHNVKAVVVLIGANNFGFADIVQSCVDRLADCRRRGGRTTATTTRASRSTSRRATSPRRPPRSRARSSTCARRCSTTATPTRRTRSSCRRTRRRSRTAAGSATRSRVDTRQSDRWLRSLEHRRQLGEQHRGADDQQRGDERRRADRPHERRRSSTTQNALVGHRLCENTVGLLEEKGLANWHSAGAADKTRVGQPDPHDEHAVRPVPAAGGRAPELLGSARAAQLPAPGVQRRRSPGRHLHASPRPVSTPSANPRWRSTSHDARRPGRTARPTRRSARSVRR